MTSATDLTANAVQAIRSTSLNSAAGAAWTVQAAQSDPPRPSWTMTTEVPATIPGEVHTDLLAADLIPDPFDGDNESALAWIGRTDWTYRTSFDFLRGSEQRHDLVAAGLDTIATVILNGTEVATTANQHRSYRFDVTELLVDGSNELVIDFEAPVNAAERLSAEIGDRPQVNVHPFNAIRKMASNYGWDWGPDVATVGIWKPISIECWNDVRLASVRPLARVDGSNGVLDVRLDLEWLSTTSADAAEVTVSVAGLTERVTVKAGETTAQITAIVSDADLWWPVGHGAQPLYDVTVSVSAESATSTWQGRVGFRNVTLSTTPDADGSEFAISVNDEPIFIRGANWIPDDAFVTRISAEKYATSLLDALEAGMNLLRVWGGGLYESEDFYTACDELGILVWQDFLFACAAYSEEDPLRSEVEAEARQAITRLSQHASLALWNGCNENIWGFVEWGWRQRLNGQSWGDGYYTEVLPALVAELDPHTPYSPGSPFSYAPYHHPNDPRHGTTHIWDVWNQVDYSHYRDYASRFVSEFGFQGPPAWSTLMDVVHDQPLDPYGAQMLVHQKAADGNLKLERGLGDHLPKWSSEDGVADMDDWHWATQLNQARALAFGIEHFRSLFPLNRGTVVWQLNDNWPVVSWAAVDAAGIRKPLWYSLRRVFADRLITIQPRDGKPTLVAHNDSPEPWSAELTISRRNTKPGQMILSSQVVTVEIPAREAEAVQLDEQILNVGKVATEFISVAAAGARSAFWFFVEDTSLHLEVPADAANVTVTRTDTGYQVTVTAKALIKDLSLFPDRLDAAARVDSGLVTLVAGDSHTFVVTSGELDERALAMAPVLRSVNDLIA